MGSGEGVKGPASAIVATFLGFGWAPGSPARWVTLSGAPHPEGPGLEFALGGRAKQAVPGLLWGKAATLYCGV
eukprot:6588262-Pyramimonas_sp.AAC.1